MDIENIDHAIYQFFGAILFLTALMLLYQMDAQLNQSIDYQIEYIHKQKALSPDYFGQYDNGISDRL